MSLCIQVEGLQDCRVTRHAVDSHLRREPDPWGLLWVILMEGYPKAEDPSFPRRVIGPKDTGTPDKAAYTNALSNPVTAMVAWKIVPQEHGRTGCRQKLEMQKRPLVGSAISLSGQIAAAMTLQRNAASPMSANALPCALRSLPDCTGIEGLLNEASSEAIKAPTNPSRKDEQTISTVSNELAKVATTPAT